MRTKFIYGCGSKKVGNHWTTGMGQQNEGSTVVQRSLFVFRLWAKGSTFILSAEINDDSNFYPMFQKAFSNVLERVVMKTVLGAAPRHPYFSPSSSTYSALLCYAMVSLLAFILRGVTDFRKSVNSSAAVPRGVKLGVWGATPPNH